MAATAARQFSRSFFRAGSRPLYDAGRLAYRGHGGRFSSTAAAKKGGGRSLLMLGTTAVAVVGGYYLYEIGGGTRGAAFVPGQKDYQLVYDEIAGRLEEKEDYDDGSYGPVLLRLAWHCSGTYDKATGTGGSNGATMRFPPEAGHGANAGLQIARAFLEPVKAKFPWISYSDLWILGGIAAVQEAQGPSIPFRPGRSDGDVTACTPDGRLPDADKDHRHIRDIFYRMGFSDQEIVALAGAHALGRCHTDRSGYHGPWTFSPTILTNDYFRLLVEEKWQRKKWDGPAQFEDKKSQSLMMLPADMAFVQDKAFKKHTELYAKNQDAFFRDFSAALTKLFELGVPFAPDANKFMLKPTNGD